jgi:hypothetical protein
MIPGKSFVLRVPIDVSRVPDFSPGRRISALAWNREGYQQRQMVSFEKKGTVTVTFELERAPDSLEVALGPEDATPFELRHLQTASVAVPRSAWDASLEVRLPAIRLTAWDWWSWQHWRQNFCVAGRVVNAHGRPVAGAAVSAFDVDGWWWWSAKEHVGSAITESDGSFVIGFTRCSGWSPAWWWATRDWQVDAALKERITGFTRQYPELGSLAAGSNSMPSLEMFQSLLNSTARRPAPVVARALSGADKAINPAALELLRARLVEILPRGFPLPIWPWSEWSPWEDCGANLIFRVTETQGDKTAVLVNEGVVEARWDIPVSLDVKLSTREATYCGTNADWTLVDYLFPFAGGRQQRGPSAGILPPPLYLRGAKSASVRKPALSADLQWAEESATDEPC